MFRLALRTLRFRKGGFAATFIALFFGAALVMACGGLMETGIRSTAAPQRLAGAAIVVSGDQTYQVLKEEDGEKTKYKSAALPERVRVDRALIDKIRAVPGVAGAVGDVSFPVADPKTGDRTTGHGWGSAALAPYTITAGHPPNDGEVVLGTPSATIGDPNSLLVPGKSREFTVSGIAAPNHKVDQRAVFFSDAEAQRLTPQQSTVDLIGITPAPGTDEGQLTSRVRAALSGTSTAVRTGDERGLAGFPRVPRRRRSMFVLAAVAVGYSLLV